MGLAHDARVLGEALALAIRGASVSFFTIPGVLVHDYDRPLQLPSAIRDQAPFDYLFLLEHAHANPPLLDNGFARKIVYVPNIEWLNELDEGVLASGRISLVMLKNRHSLEMFEQLPVARSVGDLALTGWTSEDIGSGAATHAEGNETAYDRFLHVRGVSVQKQTEVVMEAWRHHPEFPPLTVLMHFYGGFTLPGPLAYADNVTVRLGMTGSADIRRLQNSIGLHVCPSRAEGFGHSLNEARAASAVLITTAGPPMSDFVIDGENGFLVPVEPGGAGALRRSRFFDVTAEQLAAQVARLLSVSPAQRRAMGRRSRELYLRERRQFHDRVAAIFA
jgi:hypothetical protein